MNVSGKTYKYGDNVDTDVIIPARYLNTSDPKELAAHCMEDIDASFAGRVKPGEIMVAGRNFGCGSSREHAPLAIKTCGVACVIAATFARIFYRNALNIGHPGGRHRDGGLRHGPHHGRDDRADLSGRTLSAVHAGPHRRRRPRRLSEKDEMIDRRPWPPAG